MKLVEKIRINAGKTREREIRFLNIPIVQYGKKEFKNLKESYFFILPQKGFKEKILDDVILNGKLKKNETVILTRSSLGEIYILANTLTGSSLYKKEKISCLISNKEAVKDIFQLFCPQLDVKYLPLQDFYQYLPKNFYKYKNINFIIYCSYNFFNEFYDRIYNGEKLNFIEALQQEYIGNTQKIFINSPNIKNATFKHSIELFSKNYDLENLIIILPEANSCTPYNLKFWRALIKILQKNNYNVFVNSLTPEKYGLHYKQKFLSILDLYIIATKAKCIIGLRNGLIDILSSISNNTHFHVLYTRHPGRNHICITKYINAYSVKYLPNVNINNIYEYNTEEMNEKEIMNHIIGDLIK